jgi:hypothetical protein
VEQDRKVTENYYRQKENFFFPWKKNLVFKVVHLFRAIIMGCCCFRKDKIENLKENNDPKVFFKTDEKIKEKSNRELFIEKSVTGSTNDKMKDDSPQPESYKNNLKNLPSVKSTDQDLNDSSQNHLKQIIKFQLEKIEKLEKALKEAQRSSIEDQQVSETSQAFYIKHLETLNEELNVKLLESDNFSQEDITRIIAERDQMISDYNSLMTSFNDLKNHYSNLYNQYLQLTTEPDVV